jgi:hypothetical protein
MPKITFGKTTLTVEREDGDPKFYGVQYAKGESNFLYWLKNILNKEYGFDLIKKRMAKDGHMMDDMQQYLRTRSPKSKCPQVMIWNGHWQIRGIEEDWNRGTAILNVDPMYTDEEPSWMDKLMEDYKPKDTEGFTWPCGCFQANGANEITKPCAECSNPETPGIG